MQGTSRPCPQRNPVDTDKGCIWGWGKGGKDGNSFGIVLVLELQKFFPLFREDLMRSLCFQIIGVPDQRLGEEVCAWIK